MFGTLADLAIGDPLCPLCDHVEHDTAHLFECSEIVITKRPVIMWLNSVSVVDLVTEFRPSKNKSKVLPSGRHLR